MKITWTQKFLLDQMANKYLGHDWSDYEDIDLNDLYAAMIRNGASIIEIGAMDEQFKDFLNIMYD